MGLLQCFPNITSIFLIQFDSYGLSAILEKNHIDHGIVPSTNHTKLHVLIHIR